MNITAILLALAPAAPLLFKLTPFVVAPLASALATLAEKAPAFPYQGRTKAGIVAALLLAALLVRVALAWATGTLAGIDWTGELGILVDALAGAGIAAGGYAIATSSRPTLPAGEG